MENYKDNKEASKSYADLLYREQNTNEQKLQHEAACLDFAAGANWKEEQLRLSAVIGSFSLPEIWKMAQKYNCDDFVKMVEEVNRLNDL